MRNATFSLLMFDASTGCLSKSSRMLILYFLAISIKDESTYAPDCNSWIIMVLCGFLMAMSITVCLSEKADGGAVR